MHINCGFSDCELDSGAAGSSIYTGYDKSSSAAMESTEFPDHLSHYSASRTILP